MGSSSASYKSLGLELVDVKLQCSTRKQEAIDLVKGIRGYLSNLKSIDLTKSYQEGDSNYYFIGTAVIHPSKYQKFKRDIKKFVVPGKGLKFKSVEVNFVEK